MKHKHKQLLFKTYKHTICSIKKELIFKVRRILDFNQYNKFSLSNKIATDSSCV